MLNKKHVLLRIRDKIVRLSKREANKGNKTIDVKIYKNKFGQWDVAIDKKENK